MEDTFKIKKRRLLRDAIIITTSIGIAIYIQNSFITKYLVQFFSTAYFIPAAVLVGAMFAITFSAAVSTSAFVILSQTTGNPFLIALLGGLGSSLANSVFYKFFEKEVVSDVAAIEPKYTKRIGHKIMHSKLFLGLVPYLSALLLASPLPDEVGMLLLRSANYNTKHIFLLSFGFHAIGILVIIFLAGSLF